MIQEEKKFLLNDLCERLPYGGKMENMTEDKLQDEYSTDADIRFKTDVFNLLDGIVNLLEKACINK